MNAGLASEPIQGGGTAQYPACSGETAASNLLTTAPIVQPHILSLSTISILVTHFLCGKGKWDHKVGETHVFHVSDLRGHLRALSEPTWGAHSPTSPHESQWRVSSCGRGIRGVRNPFPHPMCHACIILYGTPAICLLLTVERSPG